MYELLWNTSVTDNEYNTVLCLCNNNKKLCNITFPKRWPNCGYTKSYLKARITRKFHRWWTSFTEDSAKTNKTHFKLRFLLHYWIFPFHWRLYKCEWRPLIYNLLYYTCDFVSSSIQLASFVMCLALLDKSRTKVAM